MAPDVEFHLALLEAANNDLLIPFGINIETGRCDRCSTTRPGIIRAVGVIPLHAAVFEAVRNSARMQPGRPSSPSCAITTA